MRVAAAAALALVAALAVAGPPAADAFIGSGIRSIKKKLENRSPFRPFGPEDWTPKNLRKLTNRLGGKASFSTKFHLIEDPVARANKFFDTPPPPFEAGSSSAGAKKNLKLITFDGKKMGHLSLPSAAVEKFVEGVNTNGWNVEEHPEHHHPDEQQQPHNLMLLEEGATAGAKKVFGEKPDWLKIDGTKMDQHPLENVVQLQWNNQALCSGSVIASNLVLTAAHCVYENGAAVDISGGQLSVAWKRDGTSGTVHVSDRRTVDNFWIMPGYDDATLKTKEDDIAILVLKGAAAPHGRFGFASNQKEASRKTEIGEAQLRKDGGKAYVHLTAYPGGAKKGENMWCDKCEVAPFVRDGKMAHSKCDAEPGSSGGPYWFTSETSGAMVMGVVSRRDGDTGNLMAVITTEAYDALRLALKVAGDKRPSSKTN